MYLSDWGAGGYRKAEKGEIPNGSSMESSEKHV
jgi:hypothetical protein